MKVGDIYPTRDGGQAKVVNVNDLTNIATIEITQVLKERVFADTGAANYPGGPKLPYDLILPKPYRVRRVLVYEGTKETVQRSLANSGAHPGKPYEYFGAKVTEESCTEF